MISNGATKAATKPTMKTCYFLDTEFIEAGRHAPIKLISIGILSADGREFYAESQEFDPKTVSSWLKDNVLPVEIRMESREGRQVNKRAATTKTHVRQKSAKPRSTQMKLTPTARKVLEAVSKLPNGCGANLIAEAAGIFCGKTTPIRGGQYAGKLIRAGWLHREDEWYTGSRGHEIWMGVSFTLTKKGRAALEASEAGSVPDASETS